MERSGSEGVTPSSCSCFRFGKPLLHSVSWAMESGARDLHGDWNLRDGWAGAHAGVGDPSHRATRAWNQQRDALQDAVEELRKTLLDMKAEMTAAGGELPDPGQRQNRGDSEPQRTEQDQEIEGSRGLDTSGDKGSVQTKADHFPTVLGTGPLSLQASMTCEQESSGRTSASWELGSDGQTSLHFDSKNGHWTVLLDEGRPLNRTLVSDRATTDLLVMTSAGDCRKWLEQVLCPLGTQATATATATVPSKASANRPITSVLPVILTCAVLVGILGWAFT
ncbi:hypothetical protein QTO34_014862 [Cnephaeus nilssonii]|uniref:Uncharacterized protein n=1 Tax=Cnephaeus nilssonii TaxID=3371016 RepID=A0AA40LUG2_CNENI|nr:hypothetical protein QTO34_014862 [Eptesicus nilssonii]